MDSRSAKLIIESFETARAIVYMTTGSSSDRPMEPQNMEASAYPSSLSTSPWTRRLVLAFFAALGLLMLRNILFKDYKTETKNYLKGIGRSDVIDEVVPKTRTDYLNERKSQSSFLNDLAKNVTESAKAIDSLRQEVTSLRHEVNTLKTSIPPPKAS